MSLMPRWAEESDPLVGSGLPEDLAALASSLAGGDWVVAELHGINVGLGVVGALIDPVAAVTAAGVGWAIERIDPLSTWLDDLAGDPPAVMADSALLDGTSRAVARQAQELRATSAAHLAGMEGLTIRACQESVRETTAQAELLADLLSAGATAMRVASGIVDAVRTLVRDAIAEVAGMAASSAATLAVSGGLATPIIFNRVALKGEALALKLAGTMRAMAHSFDALRALMARAETAIAALTRPARAGRRPGGSTPTAGTSATWSGEMHKRLESIRPRTKAAETLPGAAVTVIEGPESTQSAGGQEGVAGAVPNSCREPVP